MWVLSICAVRLLPFFAQRRELRLLVGLDAREGNDLTPLPGFIGNELGEIGRGARKRRAAEVGKSLLEVRIDESVVDLLVELVDDLSGRVSWCAKAKHGARLITRDEIA